MIILGGLDWVGLTGLTWLRWKDLHGKARIFYMRNFYTNFLYGPVFFTRKCSNILHAEFLHELFTRVSFFLPGNLQIFYTRNFYTQIFTRTGKFLHVKHRKIYTRYFLPEDVYTRNCDTQTKKCHRVNVLIACKKRPFFTRTF